jgi:hypothetical protein
MRQDHVPLRHSVGPTDATAVTAIYADATDGDGNQRGVTLQGTRCITELVGNIKKSAICFSDRLQSTHHVSVQLQQMRQIRQKPKGQYVLRCVFHQTQHRLRTGLSRSHAGH